MLSLGRTDAIVTVIEVKISVGAQLLGVDSSLIEVRVLTET